jgi:hypothetical protein
LRFQIVIPAREGSKRFPGKNLALLGGIPLIEHSVKYGLSEGVSDKVFVSTDDSVISLTSEKIGAEVISRPSDLARDFNPLSPPSDPVQRRLQSPSAKSNFLAVGKLLIEEAGGRCSDRAGAPLEIQSGHVIAANPHIFPDLLDTVAWTA